MTTSDREFILLMLLAILLLSAFNWLMYAWLIR